MGQVVMNAFAKLSQDVLAVYAQNVNGGRIATAEKDKCKETLISQLCSLGNLVDFLAKGDKSIILAAGFRPRKSPTSYTALVAPSVEKYIVKAESRIVTIQLSKVVGVTHFGIEKRLIVEGEDTPWINDDYATARRFKLNDLVVGKTYQFRIRAIGKCGLVSPWSGVLEVFVA